MCATNRTVILNLNKDGNSKTCVNSVKKLIARWGCPTKFVQIIGQYSNEGKIRTFVQVKTSNGNLT